MISELNQHPVVRHYLTILRDQETSAATFRQAAMAITHALILEASRKLDLQSCVVQTPLEQAEGGCIAGKVVFVPILRAGLGMLDASLQILPDASVGYIGFERDEETATAHCYYSKMPDLDEVQRVFLLDPMLATGGTSIQSIEQIKKMGAHHLSMVSIIAAPEGVACLQQAHPDVDLVTGVIDRSLDANKYIRPGVGDFGDRLFGT